MKLWLPLNWEGMDVTAGMRAVAGTGVAVCGNLGSVALDSEHWCGSISAAHLPFCSLTFTVLLPSLGDSRGTSTGQQDSSEKCIGNQLRDNQYIPLEK